ncbi:unnamed protein product [Lasius platythorax]|uniref:Uncharacterized protein n=1 Tax=Lasius platythorax TaxID=488582 RepID=A0AAV2NR55_9HYME
MSRVYHVTSRSVAVTSRTKTELNRHAETRSPVKPPPGWPPPAHLRRASRARSTERICAAPTSDERKLSGRKRKKVV